MVTGITIYFCLQRAKYKGFLFELNILSKFRNIEMSGNTERRYNVEFIFFLTHVIPILKALYDTNAFVY